MASVIRIAFARPFQWGVFKTPACLDLLSDSGVHFVQNWLQADVIVSAAAPPLLKLRRVLPWKRFLVYADDPRQDRSVAATYPGYKFLPPIHVMNVFSGDVFFDNYAFCNIHGIGDAPHPVHVQSGHFEVRRKALGGLMSYNPTMLADPGPPAGNNLHGIRVAIMEEACRVGFGFVMGSGWPASFSEEDTSYTAELAGRIAKPWAQMKLEWLTALWFNLCFENTLAPYYMSEKIWHAIMAGCVPVYFGASPTIGLDFPKGSYVDFAEFESPKHLVRHLKDMPSSDACAIYNASVDVYHRMLLRRAASRESVEIERARRIAAKLQFVASQR